MFLKVLKSSTYLSFYIPLPHPPCSPRLIIVLVIQWPWSQMVRRRPDLQSTFSQFSTISLVVDRVETWTWGTA